MSSFGIEQCILAIPTAHLPPSKAETHVEQYTAGVNTHPVERRAHARHILAQADIQCLIADGISPHLEPERSWNAQWRALVAAARAGDIDVLGMLVLQHGNYRGVEIIERHARLSSDTGRPMLVKAPEELPQRWANELHAQAGAHAPRWYWVHASIAFARQALQRNEGVILTPSAQQSAEDILALAGALTPAQQRRLAIGSSRGRGLNPFALAACEIAADASSSDNAHTVLRGGVLGAPQRKSITAQWPEKRAL